MAGAPPPLPSSRPKGAYVPPPLPSNRPKVAYVHPLPPSTPEPTHQDIDMKAAHQHPAVISTSGYGGTGSTSTQNNLGRQLQSALQDRMMNNLNEISSKQQPPTSKPQIASKPYISHQAPVSQPAQSNSSKDRPLSFSDLFGRNTDPKPQTQWYDNPSTNLAPHQSSGMFGTSPSADSKMTLSVTPEQKAVAANYSSNVAKDVAKKVSAKDMLNAGSFFASSFLSNGKASASKDQQAAMANISSQVGSSAAKNVTAKEVSHATNFAATNAVNNAAPSKEPGNQSSFDLLAQVMGSKGGGLPPPPKVATARARPKPGQASSASQPNLVAGFPPPPSPTFRHNEPAQTSSGSFVPPRAAPRAPPSKSSKAHGSGSSLIDFDAFSEPAKSGPPGLPKTKAQGPGGARLKPTIIRPGAGRSVSPAVDQQKKSKPPPRPTGPPSKKQAPLRPNAVHSTRSSGSTPPRPSGLKPKRKAPPRPGSQKGKKNAPKVPNSAPKKGALPPRPGPGHPLYNQYMGSEPHGFALFDYQGQEADELSFKTNDTIILVKRIDADWLVGKCNGRQGMFPAQFIKIVKDIGGEQTEAEYNGPQAVAIYSFDASAPDELSFHEGDTIKLLDTIGTVWYRGEFKGKTGIFPSNHVEVIIPLPSSPSSELDSGPRCKAKFDYTGESSDDLSFNEGAVIKLTQKINDEWYKGEVDGKTGIFPLAFVQIIEDMPTAGSGLSRLSPTTGNEVRATFDFDGADETELTFKDGDKIRVTAQVGTEWLEGELNGKKGRFPANFVDRVPPGLPQASDVGNLNVEPHCVVSFEFEAQGDDEISLKAGEKVTLLERIGDDWLRGKIDSREGIFPRSFVDVIIDLPEAGETPSTAKALHDFVADDAGELSFKAGDVIKITDRVNDEWLQGSIGGRSGRFPSTFVELSS